MRKYFKNSGVFILAASVALCMASCEKELDFEYHDIDPIPVVEASLTEHGAEVSLTRSVAMDEPMDTLCLTDAEVRLTDLTSGESRLLTAGEDGIFRDATPGVTGHDYSLSVSMDGKVYESSARMLAACEITGVGFRWMKMPGDDMAILQVHFTDSPQSADYYWVRVYRNGEFYAWDVITDHGAVGGVIEENITTTHRDPSQEDDEKSLLFDGDEVRVSVTPVDRRMFDYLIALLNDSDGPALFDGGLCLGYFLASSADARSVVFRPDNMEYAK